MSIWIERMEMPPDGRYTLCVTHDSDGVVHWVLQNQDTLEFLKHEAVTEVSEPHGRLIDADAITFECNKARLRPGEDFVTLSYIESKPTIIPASEESET